MAQEQTARAARRARLSAGSRPWLPAAFAIGCLLAFALVYQLTVRTTSGRLIGDASLRGAVLARSGAVHTVLDVVSVTTLLAAVVVIAVIALVRLRRIDGLAAIGLMVGANATTRLLKDYVLSRPDLGLVEVTPATLNSLPSGHSTVTFSVAAALLFVLPASARVTAAGLGAVLASATAISTMSAGWHRAGDSIAAFLVVGMWAGIATATVAALGDLDPPASAGDRTASGSVRWLAVCAAGLVTLGGTLALTLFTEQVVRESRVGPALAFVAGGLLIVGTATGVLVGILALLRPAPRPRG